MKARTMMLLLMTVLLMGSDHLLAQWIQTKGPNSVQINCFSSIGNYLFAGTGVGLYRSSNDGTTWSLVSDRLGTPSVLALAVIGTELFAGADGSGVFRSTNNGSTWFSLLGGPLSISSFAVIGTDIFAGTIKGHSGVLRSSDHGSSWISAGLTTDEIKSLAVINTSLFALTYQGNLFRSNNSGANWVSVTAGLPSNPVISLSAIGQALYAGTSAGLYRSMDYGASWTALDSILTNQWYYSLASIGTTLFVAIGIGNGAIYATNDGSKWTQVASGFHDTRLYAKGTTLFAGTTIGVFRSTDNGVNWTEVNTGFKGSQVLSLVSHGTDLYAGIWGGIFRSSDRGNSWKPLRAGSACFSLAISDNNLYAGDAAHVGCYSMDNSEDWEWVFLSPASGWVRALAFKGTDLFSGLEGSGVLRITHDAPGYWTTTQTSLKDMIVYSLAVVDSDIYAGTEQGVFQSTDNGVHWNSVNSGLTSMNVSALAANGSKLFAGTRGGGVFLSTNAGAFWTPVNNGLTGQALDILSLIFSGDNLFAGAWQGGVSLSINNGASWMAVNSGLTGLGTDVTTTIPSFAILDSTLYAGTRGAGVWRRSLPEMIDAARIAALTFSLEQNYPNPFNKLTTIKFQVPKSARITIKIYDILGREVRSLVDNFYNPGDYNMTWNGLDNFGNKVSSGIYIYKMESTAYYYKEVKKALFLK